MVTPYTGRRTYGASTGRAAGALRSERPADPGGPEAGHREKRSDPANLVGVGGAAQAEEYLSGLGLV